MPRGDGTGPHGLGPGTGQGKRGTSEFGTNSSFQKSTLGGTLFAFASMLIGNWLDKKLSQKKARDKSGQNESK
ncbi:MAG: hypothetical protein E3J44_05890 [Candidatus Aminicenantes bacterium]|nr:MAG: hypothetical protein E3J44_05890 [Candidatus Aminicenantes bacterium]